MSVEDSIRAILREELERVLAAPPNMVDRPKWLTMTALAEHLGISAQTLKTLVKRGLPHIQPGEHKRFNLDECEAWLRAQEGVSHAAE
jgi:excisionase family DNA binding protein